MMIMLLNNNREAVHEKSRQEKVGMFVRMKQCFVTYGTTDNI